MSKASKWTRLDSAARIFPSTSSRRDTKVFRFSCELTEAVDPALLQKAVDRTMEDFPFYRSSLRKGLFWYFFEETDRTPQVKQEAAPPCKTLYKPDKPGLLLRVLYYENRISLEIFHALSDGTGALQFLCMLVMEYLVRKHPDLHRDELLADMPLPPQEEKEEDAFTQYYNQQKGIPAEKGTRAHRIRSPRLPGHMLGIIEGRCSTGAMLAEAKKHDVTLSEWLTALLICSIRDGMSTRELARPVMVSVPVNLRRFFPSETARNFFGVIRVGYDFSQDDAPLETVLASVRQDFRAQLNENNMRGIINHYTGLGSSALAKAIPLAIKDPGVRFAHWLTEKEDTVALSNIGRVTLPDAITPFVRLFSVAVSTQRPQICVCTFGDEMTLCVSSPLASTRVQRNFFRRIQKLGIPVSVVSNLNNNLPQEDHSHAPL